MSKKLKAADVKAAIEFYKAIMATETKTEPKKWRDIAAAWLGEGQYGKFISIKFDEDFSIKKGETLFLNENKFKNDNPKAPDYKKSVKIEDATGEVVKPLPKDNEIPF